VIDVVHSVNLKGHGGIGSGSLKLTTTPCTEHDCAAECDVVDRKDDWMSPHNRPNPTQTAILKQPQTLSFGKVFQVVTGLILAHDAKTSSMNVDPPEGVRPRRPISSVTGIKALQAAESLTCPAGPKQILLPHGKIT
jgi:hypothetical protein